MHIYRSGRFLVRLLIEQIYTALIMNSEKKNHIVHCSFCKKSEEEVAHIIAGPHVHICNSCVEVCKEILDKEYPDYKALEETVEIKLPKGEMKVSEIVALVAPYHFDTRIRLK